MYNCCLGSSKISEGREGEGRGEGKGGRENGEEGRRKERREGEGRGGREEEKGEVNIIPVWYQTMYVSNSER